MEASNRKTHMATKQYSIYLPPEVRKPLERAAITTNRSRSFLVREALERYLDEIEKDPLTGYIKS